MRLLHKYGFTLLELMVVVAIIGLLSALSITGYSKHQAKARQAEAKLAMVSLYNLEKSFYSEYSAYIGSLDAIGYAPEGYKRYYAMGWATCANAGAVTGFAGSSGNCFYNRVNVPAGWNTTPYGNFSGAQAQFIGSWPASTLVDAQTFGVYWEGQIRDGATTQDQWWIDSNKSITNNPIGY